MATAYDFLERLGLDEDADARAIRRAYAHELKQLDQEHDAAGFQHLRECYETALDWAAWEQRRRLADAGPAPADPSDGHEAVPPPAAAAAMPTSFDMAGREVFEEFLAAMPALVALRRDPPERPWAEALARTLADERLVNLDARMGFELHLAHLLTDGWRPGHDLLFPAAARVFGWEGDRRSLAWLGEAGYVLDLALDQREGFGSQNVLARTRQRDVLALLRQPDPPSNKRVLRQMEALDQLMSCFPHWTSVMAPFGRAAEWRERYELIEGKPFVAEDPAHAGRRERWGEVVFRVLQVLLLIFVMYRTPWIFPRETAEAARLHAERLRDPKPVYEDEAPPPERIEEIGKRIAYRPGPKAQAAELTVRFQVLLDADGSVLGVNRLEESGDPAFDEAVKQAVLGSERFPPRTSKVFQVKYSMSSSAPVSR
jgi:protein TonB